MVLAVMSPHNIVLELNLFSDSLKHNLIFNLPITIFMIVLPLTQCF